MKWRGDFIVDMFFFVGVAIGLPIVFLLYALYRKRFVPFFLGAMAFVMSQIVIRIPLLNYAAEHSSTFQWWQVTKPLFMLFALALSAGVAEECARWLFMRFFLANKTYQNGIVFGFGHGGIEALLIVGLPAIQQMQFIGSTQLLLGGVERLCAIVVHICLSIVVLIGVRKGAFRYCSYAIMLHTMINFTVVCFATTGALVGAEIVFIVCTLLLVVYVIWISRREKYEKVGFSRL